MDKAPASFDWIGWLATVPGIPAGWGSAPTGPSPVTAVQAPLPPRARTAARATLPPLPKAA